MNEIFLSSDEAAVLELTRNEERARRKYLSANGVKLKAREIRVKLGMADCDDEDEEDMNPIKYQVVGNTAILGIAGITRNNSTWITQIYGTPTYDDIRMRFQKAYDDPAVKAVVMNINSQGGEARGVKALSDFISQFDSKIMPVIGYTSASCCSAAVWYGTAGSALSADPDAEVGSIGAVCVFMSQARALKDNGYDVKVFRSGPYKAVPSNIEKLDDKGTEVLNEQIAAGYNKFLIGLSKNLGKTPAVLNSSVGSGKVFSADKALEVGLVKSLISFEQLIANLNTKLDNTNRLPGRA